MKIKKIKTYNTLLDNLNEFLIISLLVNDPIESLPSSLEMKSLLPNLDSLLLPHFKVQWRLCVKTLCYFKAVT